MAIASRKNLNRLGLTIAKIRHKDFKFYFRTLPAHFVDTITEMPRSAIGQVVAVDACDYEIMQFKLFRQFRYSSGSVASAGFGLPLGTEQNLQPRVQILPRIKTVAVPLAQHWPRLGQFALIHIVSMPSEPTMSLVLLYSPAVGIGLLNHSGNRRFLFSVLFLLRNDASRSSDKFL